jgi:hypothetical protein
MESEISKDWFKKFKKLQTVRACGATEADDGPERVEVGYRFLQNFFAGRNLRYSGGQDELPWLLRAKKYTKRWEGSICVHPPYYDHSRCFIDKDTKQRIWTIQPYFLRINDATRLPQEFYDICNREEPDPQEPLWKEVVNGIVEKARKESETFAQAWGLQAEVSTNGWYNPGKTILIEYRVSAV